MAKLRKRPKPADPEAPEPPVVPDPPEPPPAIAAATPPATIFDKPDVIHPTVVQLSPPILDPKTPDDLVHNVMTRQLADDALNPPPQDYPDPALALLGKIQTRRDRRQPLNDLLPELEALVQGLEAENRVTALVYRTVQNRKLRELMESTESLDRLLNRMYRRGDLTPAEAIVFKRMTSAELCVIVKDLLVAIDENVTLDPQAALTTMDHTSKTATEEATRKWEGTTPAGREIIRKVAMVARRKIYETEESISTTSTTTTKQK